MPETLQLTDQLQIFSSYVDQILLFDICLDVFRLEAIFALLE